MSKDLAVSSQQLPQLNSTEILIQTALQNKDLRPEIIESLMQVRETVRKEQIKSFYDEAMSDFQGRCPVIAKTKVVMNKDGKTKRYSYAPLDSIVDQVRELLKESGFSYMVTAKIDGGQVEASCRVTHIAGHSEESTFKVPIDKDAFMNEQQKVASALTYAKRYAFCNAFGILTGDEDDDSTTAGDTASHPAPPTQERSSSPNSIVVGLVTNITQAPTRTGGTRYKIFIAGDPHNTFDRKIAELAKTIMQAKGKIRVVVSNSQYGNDIVEASAHE